ncbi:hypothetical protein CCUS01_16822, partial [Colletotrichum cuscutae]
PSPVDVDTAEAARFRRGKEVGPLGDSAPAVPSRFPPFPSALLSLWPFAFPPRSTLPYLAPYGFNKKSIHADNSHPLLQHVTHDHLRFRAQPCAFTPWDSTRICSSDVSRQLDDNPFHRLFLRSNGLICADPPLPLFPSPHPNHPLLLRDD